MRVNPRRRIGSDMSIPSRQSGAAEDEVEENMARKRNGPMPTKLNEGNRTQTGRSPESLHALDLSAITPMSSIAGQQQLLTRLGIQPECGHIQIGEADRSYS